MPKYGVVVLILWGAGCAGTHDPDGFSALTLGAATDDGGTSGGDATGAPGGTKTGGDPPGADDGSSGAPGFDVDEATTSGADDGSTGAFDDTTGGDDPGTTGAVDSDGGAAIPGAPMYAPCEEGEECADGVCLKLVVDGTQIGSYCTAACAVPALDCEASGNATSEVCLSVDQYVLCGLECTGGLPCPGAMTCVSFSTGDYCF